MTHKANIWQGNERREANLAEFDVFKKILGTIGGLLLVQMIGAIWWASSQTTTLSFVKNDLSDLKIAINKDSDQRYRSTDALRDFNVVNQRIDKLESMVRENSKSIASFRK